MKNNRHNKTLLTVDWDYFIPEDPYWDFQRMENLFSLRTLWLARGSRWQNVIKTTGEENRWWDKLHRRFEIDTDTIYVSDSHLFAAKLGTYDQIITVDAHHDMWPPSVNDPDATLWCDNWLRQYLQLNPNTTAYWVQAEWAKETFQRKRPGDKDYTDLWKRVRDGWPKAANITTVHVCRSGCWTPPWLDDRFIDFVEDPGAWTQTLQFGDWDPMVSRWDDEMRAHHKAFDQLEALACDPRREEAKR